MHIGYRRVAGTYVERKALKVTAFCARNGGITRITKTKNII